MADAYPMVRHCRWHQRDAIKFPVCPSCKADVTVEHEPIDLSPVWRCPIGCKFIVPEWRSGADRENCLDCNHLHEEDTSPSSEEKFEVRVL